MGGVIGKKKKGEKRKMGWRGVTIECVKCGEGMRVKVESASNPRRQVAQASPDGPYRAKTPVQRVVLAYKIAKGFKAEDRAWDQEFYAMNASYASRLLNLLGQDPEKAIDCIADSSERFDKLGMPSWSLSAVCQYAPEWLRIHHAR